ncbi:hypothetical protein KC19_5G080300 [Ceratodon purpureus]|uniref:Uncharacterized protein n=1 Tax=Ceratodon purpureus TaxID=3225 RepID=A0A8T0I1A0_CERPU|nr:hypothetical protein KC19_5G080300 [Ceratodon purpureus]
MGTTDEKEVGHPAEHPPTYVTTSPEQLQPPRNYQSSTQRTAPIISLFHYDLPTRPTPPHSTQPVGLSPVTIETAHSHTTWTNNRKLNHELFLNPTQPNQLSTNRPTGGIPGSKKHALRRRLQRMIPQPKCHTPDHLSRCLELYTLKR